jgi:hypothetical protein
MRLKDLTEAEVIAEAKEILFQCEDISGKKLERFSKNLKASFLDNSIVSYKDVKINPEHLPKDRNLDRLYNKEPLFINKTYTYHLRPEASTQFSNLFMASDFIKTNADLGCMDSADEAARRAVNNIFEKNYLKPACKIKSYAMPSFFGLFSTARILDYKRFQKGLPYSDKTIVHRIIKFFLRAARNLFGGKLPFLVKIPLIILTGIAFFMVAFLIFLLRPLLLLTHARPA